MKTSFVTSLLFALACSLFVLSGCATVTVEPATTTRVNPYDYVTHDRALLDLVDRGSRDLVRDIKLGEKDRVTIVDLDGGGDPQSMPWVVVSDMLAMGLHRQGHTVVEWDGDIATQSRPSSHSLGYRVLYYGVSIQTTDNRDIIQRVLHADIVLRLVDNRSGTVAWTDRIIIRRSQDLPSVLRSQLMQQRFQYVGPQYGTWAQPVTKTRAAAPGPLAPAGESGTAKPLFKFPNPFAR
ncbi:MAG: hypothetical protein VX498_15320 [Myxococcota bacterium]|nr:hypothetical protein [Myxococcota bacterium]